MKYIGTTFALALVLSLFAVPASADLITVGYSFYADTGVDLQYHAGDYSDPFNASSELFYPAYGTEGTDYGAFGMANTVSDTLQDATGADAFGGSLTNNFNIDFTALGFDFDTLGAVAGWGDSLSQAGNVADLFSSGGLTWHFTVTDSVQLNIAGTLGALGSSNVEGTPSAWATLTTSDGASLYERNAIQGNMAADDILTLFAGEYFFNCGIDTSMENWTSEMGSQASLDLNVYATPFQSVPEPSSMLLTNEPVAGSEKNRKAVSPASVIR